MQRAECCSLAHALTAVRPGGCVGRRLVISVRRSSIASVFVTCVLADGRAVPRSRAFVWCVRAFVGFHTDTYGRTDAHRPIFGRKRTTTHDLNEHTNRRACEPIVREKRTIDRTSVRPAGRHARSCVRGPVVRRVFSFVARSRVTYVGTAGRTYVRTRAPTDRRTDSEYGTYDRPTDGQYGTSSSASDPITQ